MSKKKVSFKWAFKEYIWPRRKLLSLGLVLIVIRSLSGLVLPIQTRFLIDDVVPSGSISMLWKLVLIVGGAILVQAVTSFALTQLLSVEAQLLISKLRAQVQKKLLALPTAFFDNNKSCLLYTSPSPRD